MEVEYKWNMPDTAIAEQLVTHSSVAGHVRETEAISMRAVYYDSTDGIVAAAGGGLRVRRENGESVCSLKLPVRDEAGCTVRNEYEAPAHDVREGLAKLPDQGAPRELCARLLGADIVELCETNYERQALLLDADDFEAELAIDVGTLGREGRKAPIHEIELEYKGGSQEAFRRFAAGLAERFALVPELLPKLARAMAV